MAQPQPPRLYDGFMALPRGMHSGRAKTLLSGEHVAFATNCTFRGDLPHARPGWSKVDVDLSALTGRYQGAAVFEPIQGASHLIASVGGHLFKIDVTSPTPSVQDVTLAGDENAGNLEQAWFCQTPGYLVIQDGQARAQIWNGASLRRANTAKREVPVGTAMAYGNGRLWVTLPDRRSFVASDLIYTDTGTPSQGYRDSVLRFTENEFIAGGGAFGVPVEAGAITAMRFMGVADTSTGQGPLLVGTERSTFSVNAPFDRLAWTQTTSPIQTVLLPDSGPTGPWAMCPVNGDVWYRDRLGVRSAQTAYRDFGRWTNTPLSRPMRRIMDSDDRRLLRFASAVEFDNRFLVTTTPQRDSLVGVFHMGLAALDFDQVSDSDDMGLSTASPVWDGLWTGLRFLQLVTGRFEGVDRCFLFVWNQQDEEIELWELSVADRYDDAGDEIVWTLETPDYPFGFPNERKDLKGAKLWVNDMTGSVRVLAQYKPDDYPAWQEWHQQDLCAPTLACGADACEGTPAQPQSRAVVFLPQPPLAQRDGQRLPATTAHTYSAKLTITGSATLSRLRLEAVPVADDRGFPSCAAEACESVLACPDDPYAYLDGADGVAGIGYRIWYGRSLSTQLGDAALGGLDSQDLTAALPTVTVAAGYGYVYFAIPTSVAGIVTITSDYYTPGVPIPVAMADKADGYTDTTNGVPWYKAHIGSVPVRVYRTKHVLNGAVTINLS